MAFGTGEYLDGYESFSAAEAARTLTAAVYASAFEAEVIVTGGAVRFRTDSTTVTATTGTVLNPGAVLVLRDTTAIANFSVIRDGSGDRTIRVTYHKRAISALGATLTGAFFNIQPGVASLDLVTSVGIGLNIEADTWDINASGDSETVAIGALAFVGIPTWTSTGLTYTVTDAATVYIQGVPVGSTNVTLTNAYALWVDAGETRLDGVLTVTGASSYGAALTGSFFNIQPGIAQLDLVTSVGIGFHIEADTWDINAAGNGETKAVGALAFFGIPTWTSTGTTLTVTDAATVYIEGVPVGSTNTTVTNAYALWVDAGTARFDGVVLNATRTALDDTGTPSVSAGNVFDTGGTTAITDFDDGVVGQVIYLVASHTVTITDGASLDLAAGSDYVMTATDTLMLMMFDDQVWHEMGRSVNGG